ncbi:hypothetical protein RDI58_010827 [Solanum bulbocastanum]|uniref:Uncharacterized protein n=1 Tax=Solanum bulbocastanum TaxID=147425 RepID=A0AAN8TUB4_SOLBU
MSSHSAKCTGDSGGHLLMHRTCSLSNNDTEHRSLHNEVEEASPPLSCVNSTKIDGLHDLKFQSSVKSDTIYRGSNSFSNEEIVEHLRRTRNDCLNNYDESSAFSPVKNSMNSNILAMNFGSRDDSLTLRHSLTGLCNEPNRQHDSWKFLHSDSGQGFSFMKQDGSSSQRADLNSSSRNISLISKQASILHDFSEKKEQHMLDSQYQISRPKGMAPPGFSISSRELPPGFPLSDEICGFRRTLSGSQLVNSSSSLIHHPSSMRSFSSAGLEIGSQSRALEDAARLWLLMQRKHADRDGKFSHVLASQTPSAYQDQRFNGADEHTSAKNLNGFSPRLVDQGQSFDQSLYTHFPPQKFGNGPISNGFQLTCWEISNVEMRWTGWQNLREVRD